MLPKSNKKVVEGKRFSPVTTTKDSANTPVGNPTPKLKNLIWPEFTDVDSEKWEFLGKTKDVAKTKSPVTQYFDDPEGKVELPPSLKVDCWKRPHEILGDKIPVIVENNSLNMFDLITNNEHLHESEVMRNIIGQIIALWEFSSLPAPHLFAVSDPNTPFINYTHSWRPWEHLYALCKSGKGPHMPLYNPHGKYIVRLYFMGCWRKLIIDDTLPFEKDKLLLPTTTQPQELWPMLLTKALLKVASLNYTLNCGSNEIGEFNVLHTLTGWLPEVVPIIHKNVEKTWQFLTNVLPEWKPGDAVVKEEVKLVFDPIPTDTLELVTVNPSKSKECTPKAERAERDHGDKHESRTGTSRKGKDKDKDKDKDKNKDKKDTLERELSRERFNVIDVKNNENSGLMVFATHWTPPSLLKASSFSEMATASERLRQIGLSYFHPHPVWISQSRTLPLEPQTPPYVIPNWQLIRPRKKKHIPYDEPQIIEPSTPIKCLELATAFLNYKINPVSIPSTITRTKQKYMLDPDIKLRVLRKTPSIKEIEEEDEEILPLVENTEPEVNISGTCSLLDTNELENRLRPPQLNNVDKLKQGKSSASEKLNNSFNSDKKNKKLYRKDSLEGNVHLNVENHTDAHSTSRDHMDKDGCRGSEFELPATLPNIEHTGFKKTWVNFDLFCKSFNSLCYYHKSALYQNNIKVSDIRMNSSLLEEKSIYYLFLDGLGNSELAVSYSSLSRWNDICNFKEVIKVKDEVRISPNSLENSSYLESGSVPSLQPGQLTVEPYSWKSLVIGQPILLLRTTATRAVTLTLPPGRHVLKFMMTSPLGFSIHLSSDNPFIFGDEETIMNQCAKESCHFIEAASQLILTIEECIENFHFEEKYKKAEEKLKMYLFPAAPTGAYSKRRIYQNFKEFLLRLLSKASSFNTETLFAWRAFFFDVNWKNPPAALQQANRLKAEKHDPLPVIENNIDSQIAAVKIQRFWRGAYVRKIKKSRIHGTADNLFVRDVLKNYWLQVKPNIEEIGLNLFRILISKNPKISPYYTFYKDDWHKISYTDYQGVYSDQPPDTWFVVFREVFLVSEETMIVPKLYVSLKTCFLRVINNDNGAEINRVFKQVSPFVYRKNKRGYTFIAEARTLEQALPSGKWRLRLIGSNTSFLHLQKSELNTHLYIQDIKHYYIPSDIYPYFMCYSVKVTEDHLATLQMSTSKPDVQFQLTVLDYGEVVCNVKGKGHVVIPSIIFLKDVVEEEPVNSNSKESIPGKRKISLGDAVMCHKYKIQATVLNNSWPLVPIDWQFIQVSKSSMSNELRMDFKESDTPSPSLKVEKTANHIAKVKSNKVRSGREFRETKEPRPVSLQFDTLRPHWILRFVSDPDCAEQVEIKRDKSRAEEIRHTKKAWEEAEPGRAAKANVTHQKYLNAHLVSTEVDKEVLDSVLESFTLTIEPPSILLKDRVPRMDLCPYMKNKGKEVKYLTKELMNYRQTLKEMRIQEYRLNRKKAEEWLENERRSLKILKAKQIESSQQMQLKLDLARENFFHQREEYRQSCIKVMEENQIDLDEKDLKPPSHKKGAKKGPNKALGKSSNKGKK